jgi:hypothetical protein
VLIRALLSFVLLCGCERTLDKPDVPDASYALASFAQPSGSLAAQSPAERARLLAEPLIALRLLCGYGAIESSGDAGVCQIAACPTRWPVRSASSLRRSASRARPMAAHQGWRGGAGPRPAAALHERGSGVRSHLVALMLLLAAPSRAAPPAHEWPVERNAQQLAGGEWKLGLAGVDVGLHRRARSELDEAVSTHNDASWRELSTSAQAVDEPPAEGVKR